MTLTKNNIFAFFERYIKCSSIMNLITSLLLNCVYKIEIKRLSAIFLRLYWMIFI